MGVQSVFKKLFPKRLESQFEIFGLDFMIDDAKCTRCKECVRDCPSRVIVTKGKKAVPELSPEAEQNCIRCQHCLAICPTGALSILGKHPEASTALVTESLPM